MCGLDTKTGPSRIKIRSSLCFRSGANVTLSISVFEGGDVWLRMRGAHVTFLSVGDELCTWLFIQESGTLVTRFFGAGNVLMSLPNSE